MKKAIIFLLVLFAAIPVKGQSFPGIDKNPSWRIGVWSFWFSSCEAFNWRYGNAVAICGKQYIEAVECDHANTNCTVKGYIRVDQQKVYVRKTNACTETERLMYDFSLSVSGAYNMAYNIGSIDSTRAQVTTTQSVNYQGVSRLTQNLTYTVDPPANNYTETMQAIEGIGCDIHPFFPLVCFGDFCETNLQLVEYKEGNTVLYSKTPVFPLACTGWVGLNEFENNYHASVFPTPAAGLITIKADHDLGSIRLVDCFGRTVAEKQSIKNKEELDVSGLSKGVYFIELYNSAHLKVLTKKVIRE